MREYMYTYRIMKNRYDPAYRPRIKAYRQEYEKRKKRMEDPKTCEIGQLLGHLTIV